jgi:two-component system NarL family sensor kinase
LNKIIENKGIDKEQKELFMISLFHDLKNPIKGQIDILKMLLEEKFGELNNSQEEIIKSLLDSEVYLNNLLLSILSIYKNNNQGLSLNLEEINLSEFIEEILKYYKFLAQNKHIEIIENIEENIFVKIDVMQMQRVISNILINSIEYSYSKTKMLINVRTEEEKVIISIQNKSPEIPQDIQKLMFKNVFSTVVKHKNVGFGMGLYFAKQIVDAHKGKIYIKAEGKDNTFVIEIAK